MNAAVDPAEQLLSLAAEYLRRLRGLFGAKGLHIRARGTFAALVVTFCWKQEDHAAAILALGRHRDIRLIARSMIEGLCQLKWAAKDPRDRAMRWHLYAWIHDWRLMQRKLRSGEQVPTARRKRIEEGVNRHGHLFLSKRGARRKAREVHVRDPYMHHWSGRTVAQLCEEVQGQFLHDWPYAEFSDWHHWSPGGVIGALQADGRTIRLPVPKARELLPSYVVAFQCLHESLELASNVFNLGQEQELAAIREDFVRDLRPAGGDSSAR